MITDKVEEIKAALEAPTRTVVGEFLNFILDNGKSDLISSQIELEAY